MLGPYRGSHSGIWLELRTERCKGLVWGLQGGGVDARRSLLRMSACRGPKLRGRKIATSNLNPQGCMGCTNLLRTRLKHKSCASWMAEELNAGAMMMGQRD